MNIIIYIALIILVLLIIFYFCFKAYLINTKSTTITINDGELIDNECIYHNNSTILSCTYSIDKQKIFITKMIESIINNANTPITFNAKNLGLPKNGILEIKFISHLNKKSKYTSKINTSKINNLYDNKTNKYNSISYNRNKLNTENVQVRQKKAKNIFNFIESTIENNIENSILNTIENTENNNSDQNSYFMTMFNNKYPKMTATNKMANIDSEYFIGGLNGDARLLDINSTHRFR